MSDTANQPLHKIDYFNDIKPIQFIDTGALNKALKYLSELGRIFGEMLEIIENNQEGIPDMIKKHVTGHANNVRNFIASIEATEKGEAGTVANKKSAITENIKNFHANVFNPTPQNNDNKFLMLYAYLKAISGASVRNAHRTEELIVELEEKSEEAKKAVGEATTLVDELKRKTSKEAVADYAKVFQTEADDYGRFARNWLIAGGILIVLFIVLIVTFHAANIIPIERLSGTGEFLRYDISNIFLRLLIYSLVLFLIGFSFRQYGINRHLNTLNRHRQNALNSYKLFTESIIGNDDAARNTLMVQVAKAIYEHSQTTGFVSDKGGNSPTLIELTKIISKNSAS